MPNPNNRISTVFLLCFYCISIVFLLFFYSKNPGQIAGLKSTSSNVEVSLSIGEYRFSLFGYTSPHALVTISGMGIFDQTLC